MAESTISANILYKTYLVNIDAASGGTIGTRAAYSSIAIGISGYIPVSATIGRVASYGTNYRVDVYIDNENLWCIVFRTQSTAFSAFTMPVRVMYIKSGT